MAARVGLLVCFYFWEARGVMALNKGYLNVQAVSGFCSIPSGGSHLGHVERCQRDQIALVAPNVLIHVYHLNRYLVPVIVK